MLSLIYSYEHFYLPGDLAIGMYFLKVNIYVKQITPKVIKTQ
ncbi:MAG: hypothetical protein U0X91_09220 [Spirosomataceae bacterium]